MDDFDRLLALTQAAESCNGSARQFIDYYGDEPEFSRFLSAPDQPYCQPAADSQARQHMDRARNAAEKMRGYVREWDDASAALDYINRVACQWPEFTLFDGTTCLSAHEAARNFASDLAGIFCRVQGWTDIECAFDLARRLADVRPIPDFYGRITKEHYAASELVELPPLSDEQQGAAAVPSGDAAAADGKSRRRNDSEWRKLYDKIEQEGEPHSDSERNAFIVEYNKAWAGRPRATDKSKSYGRLRSRSDLAGRIADWRKLRK